MFSTGSSENSKVVPYHATNCAENSKNTNGPLSCHHNIPPPPLYSSNTTMLSFNNVEQSYTRVVGQVYSRETVTTIYGDPTPSNCWNQRQVGFYCYVCHSVINPQEFHSLIPCSSTNCEVYAHAGCLMKIGCHDRNGPWYCQRCMSTNHQSFSTPVRSVDQITSNPVENNPSPPINPLHLLLEASDQIQSNSGPDNNISLNTPVTQRETTSSQYPDVNTSSSRTDFISCDQVPDQRLLTYNMNIELMNTNNDHNDTETIPSKFKAQYASFNEERNNVIRNLERTRMRQDKVSDALKDSLARLTDEFNKHLKNNRTLREDNVKLNNALQKLKLALIPLAQERPVLQVLRKITQNDDLKSHDITTDNVLHLFMGLLPSNISNFIGTSLSNNVGNLTSSSALHSSSMLESSQKCSKIGEKLIRCYHCQKVQHVECCNNDEKSSIDTINERWTCVDCKDSDMVKRKHCNDKKSNSNGPSLTLIGSYKRIKTNDKNSLKDNSTLYNISTHNLDNGGGVLSPQLTPQQLKSTNGSTQNTIEDMMERFANAMPHTPMSDDDKLSSEDNDSSFSSDLEMDDENHNDDSTLGTFDRTPPPDNGPEASRQPARFDGDMYTPRWVRGVGKSKEGLCPHCEPARWLKTKISAYWYHLNYQHGISSITGRPFAQPVAERLNKKSGMKEALCHKCNKWILNQSPRDKEVLVPEIYWYKHAQKCHHSP